MAEEPRWLGEGPSGGDVLAGTLADAGIGWVVWEPGSGQVSCSDVAATLMGVGPVTWTDLRSWLAGIASRDRLAVEEALSADAGIGTSHFVVEYRLARPEAGARRVEVRGRLRRDADGVLRGSALLLDVSDARAREELVRISEARFREAFAEAAVAMVLTTHDDVLVDVNQAFEELAGYGRDEVVGHSARDLGFWSSPEDQRKLDAFLASDEGSATLDLHLRTRSGRVREVLISITRLPAGQEAGLVKVLLDVTERRGLERKLVQALRGALRDTDWLAQRLLKELDALEGQPARGAFIADFTRRERQVLELLARGLGNEAVAAELGVTPSTVRNYVSNIYSKLGVDSRAEAVVWARERGLDLE